MKRTHRLFAIMCLILAGQLIAQEQESSWYWPFSGKPWLLWSNKTEDALCTLIEDYKQNGVKVDPTIIEKVEKKLEHMRETLEKTTLFANLEKSNKNWENSINELHRFNQETHALNENLKESIFLKKNTAFTIKTCAFAVVGCTVSCIGAKILYDSIKNIVEKLNAPEHQKKSWHTVLTQSDYLYVIAGAATLGCGLKIIEKSDSLAQ